jgi:hypothetical protein
MPRRRRRVLIDKNMPGFENSDGESRTTGRLAFSTPSSAICQHC